MNKASGVIAVLVSGLLLGSVPAAQTDWYVDVHAPGCATGAGTLLDPFCDVMDAVAAASDGDTILIAPGTYFENVVLDKALTLIGTGGQQVTILDGTASGSVVVVRDASVTLAGLTLTNGTGTSYQLATYSMGGGLFVYSPLNLYPVVQVHDCSIVDNFVAGYGGGVANGTPSSGSIGVVTLTNTTVSGNRTSYFDYYCGAYGCSYYFGGGGGVFTSGVLNLMSSTVSDNHAYTPGNPADPNGRGGGVYSGLSGTTTLMDSTISGNSAWDGGGMWGNLGSVIEDSLVSGNYAKFRGGGISAGELNLTVSAVTGNTVGMPPLVGDGGGLFLFDATITDSEVSGNSSIRDGGGIFLVGDLTMTNTSVSGNTARVRGGGMSTGRSAMATAVNSTFLGNSTADSSGGGVSGGGIRALGTVVLVNTTMAGNSAPAGDAIALYEDVSFPAASLDLGNSILWSNGPSPLALLGSGSPVVTASYSNIEGGWPGSGNLNTDPLFVDPLNGNIRLSAGSPCIDAGNNALVPPGVTTDIRGFPRFFHGITDMGAYEFGPRVRNARSVPVPVAPPRRIR